MKLSIGFSPCPNDTFIFDAMIHQKIDTEGLEFNAVIEDVEQLNRMAFAGALDISKLSYHAFLHLAGEYALLQSGSALGNNCGPLLIAKKNFPAAEVESAKIAIPGKYTTANLLLKLAFPAHTDKVEMLFSEIEDAVLSGSVDAGVIIHENRFTYTSKGLVKVMDLGEFWESNTALPIPLGGIAMKRNFPLSIREKVDRVLKRSVLFAMEQPEQTIGFVSRHAREMDREVMFSHIDLYVNNYTVELGSKGNKAVRHLFDQCFKQGIIQTDYQELLLS